MENSIKIREFNVPVSWGHIAVKAWGDERNTAVLVVHGRMDNAGSFDGLIPLLPDSFYYICIDLPGHGRSTHFPPYLPIYTVNFIPVYKLIMQFFQRKSYIILAHSYGAQIGFLFAQLYPNYVSKLIMLESIHTFPIYPKRFKSYLVSQFNSCIELNEKMKNGNIPTYTYEEAFTKLVNGRFTGTLTTLATTALLQRSITSTKDGKYIFTLDQRMKFYFQPLHGFRYAVESMKNDPVTCPVLIILAKESTFPQIYLRPIIQYLKKLENIVFKYVDGDHDVHMNNPDIVAPHVAKFLLTQKSKI